jgi:hypothetical protein
MKNIFLLILCLGFIQVMGQNLSFEIDVVDDNGSDPAVSTSTVFVYVTNISGYRKYRSSTLILYSAKLTPGSHYTPTNLMLEYRRCK